MKKIINELKVIFNRKQKIELVFLFILIVGGAFCELLGVSAIVPFIQAIMTPDELLKEWYVQYFYDFFNLTSNNQLIVGIAIILIIIYIIKNIYLCVMSYFQYRFTFKNQYQLSQQMLGTYINRPYEYHLNHGSAELMRNVIDDTEGCYSFVLCVLQLASEMTVCIALALFLLIQSPGITIGIVLILSIYVILYAIGVKTYIKKLGQKERKQRSLMNKWIMEALGGIKETKILQREGYFNEQFKKDTDKLGKTRMQYNIISYMAKPIIETICIVSLLVLVSVKVATGTDVSHFISIIAVFAVAAFRLLPSINRITNSLSMIMFRKPAVDALYKDITELTDNHKVFEQEEDKSELLNYKEKIELKDIAFRYEGMEKTVLEHVAIDIPKDKSIAFIGPSGEGKTTLADIILGLLVPEKGKILVDGIDIYSNMDAWYQKLGYIPQSIFLLDDSLKHNIAFGIPDEQIDIQKLNYAIKEAQIQAFIEELPEGLNTMVGERGVRLSGGQRQRIGIARALYKNPDILILDEATSALDNDTERAVMQAIDNLGGKKTLIIIAHRLSTIRNCDIVYKVQSGRVQKTELNEE